MSEIDGLRKANKESAAKLKWGVLPAGDYVGADDPLIIGDAVEFDAVNLADVEPAPTAFDTAVTAKGVVMPRTVARLKALLKLSAADQKKRFEGRPGAARFARNIDLAPDATRNLNIAAGAIGLGGGTAGALLMKGGSKAARRR